MGNGLLRYDSNRRAALWAINPISTFGFKMSPCTLLQLMPSEACHLDLLIAGGPPLVLLLVLQPILLPPPPPRLGRRLCPGVVGAGAWRCRSRAVIALLILTAAGSSKGLRSSLKACI